MRQDIPAQIYDHAVIDIETLSTRRNAVVLSLGIQTFDYTPDCNDSVSKDNCYFFRFDSKVQTSKLNRSTDEKTIEWWEEQPWEARALSFGPPISSCVLLNPDMYQMTEEMRLIGDRTLAVQLVTVDTILNHARYIWGYGAAFDNAVLSDLLAQMGLGWNHRQDRCLRTIASIAPEFKYDYRGCIPHSPIDDAFAQAKKLQHCLDYIGDPRQWYRRLGDNGTYMTSERE